MVLAAPETRTVTWFPLGRALLSLLFIVSIPFAAPLTAVFAAGCCGATIFTWRRTSIVDGDVRLRSWRGVSVIPADGARVTLGKDGAGRALSLRVIVATEDNELWAASFAPTSAQATLRYAREVSAGLALPFEQDRWLAWLEGRVAPP